MKQCWKIFCPEQRHPGLWRKWWEEQCVAVGFAPQRGYRLHEKSDNSGWNRARSCLKQIKAGDEVVVQLAKHRVARVGEVLEPKIEDHQWEPTSVKDGCEELGRRIRINWRLNLGPSDPDIVVNLPESARLSGKIRLTIAKLRDVAFNAIAEAIRDEGNWASMFSYFPYEKALSEYVARFPQKIEAGLTTHPHTKKLLPNGKLVDVLLMDKDGTPVVVECKRDSVTAADIDQLEGYVDEMKRETGKSHVRGILIHAGARVLSENLSRKVEGLKHLRVFQYQLDVNFNLCQ